MVDVILEDDLANVVDGGTHGCDLDQYFAAVPAVLDHIAHGFQMSDGTIETVYDGTGVLVTVMVPVIVSMFVVVIMSVIMCMFVCVFFMIMLMFVFMGMFVRIILFVVMFVTMFLRCYLCGKNFRCHFIFIIGICCHVISIPGRSCEGMLLYKNHSFIEYSIFLQDWKSKNNISHNTIFSENIVFPRKCLYNKQQETGGKTNMNLLDIIGPVMVGPSSSHTAGAVKIGRVSRKLMAEEIVRAEIYFHGSFLATGKGHGTDKALIAGLLGMQVDDPKIPQSFEIAKEKGMEFVLAGIDLGDVHPNSVKMNLTGVSGRTLEVVAASIGGGSIKICELDGLTANFSGDYPTLIVHNIDQPGHVTEVTSMLAHKSVNIATMQLYRASRGGNAVMVIECDQEVPEESIAWLERLEGIIKVTYLSLE